MPVFCLYVYKAAGGRVGVNILVGYLIVLVSQWGFVDPTIPPGLGRRQHKQNAIIACILSREKILDIAFEAPFSFIDITLVIFVYIRVYKKRCSEKCYLLV